MFFEKHDNIPKGKKYHRLIVFELRMRISCLLFQVVVVSLTAGVALLGVLARYLKRRKTPKPLRRTRKLLGRRSRNSVRSPNGVCVRDLTWIPLSSLFLELVLMNKY